MQGDEKQPIQSSQIKNQYDYESDPLLLLQSRQIVHHMLIIEDWIILSIETPHQKSVKKNFTKIKSTHHYTSNQHESQSLKSITRLVSVMAIRTEDKNIVNMSKKLAKQKKQINSAHQLQQLQNTKSSIGEIKMLHKQCRLQNIILWSNPTHCSSSPNISNKNTSVIVGNDKSNFINNQFQQHQDRNNVILSTIMPKQFVLLTYTRIQLYTVQYIGDHSSIQLVRIFQTPFLIPFNLIWLKNQKLPQTQKYPNHSRQKSHLSSEIKFKQNKNIQQFQIALSGIDRSQTFWSGYYQIQNHKRNIYLLRNFDICPKQNNQHKKVLKDFKSPSKQLRRVKSAQNVFNFKSPFKGQKQKLTSTEHFTKQSLTFDNQQITFQNKFSNPKQNLNKKLLQFKQALPNEFISRIENKNNPIKQKIIQKIVAKQLQYDEKIEIHPKLIPWNKFLHNDKHSLSPALQYFSHFYIEVSQHSHFISSKKDEQQNKKHQKVRKHFELMLIVSYFNSLVLINAQRKQMISKVDLQPNVSIISMTRIQSIFGIHNIIVLTKDLSNFQKKLSNIQKNLSKIQKKSKLIKVTVDGISWDKLGIGLQKLNLSSLSEQQQQQDIIKIDNIWQQSLIDEINSIIEESYLLLSQNMKVQYQIDQDPMKQSTLVENNNKQQNIQISEHSDSFIQQLQNWRGIPLNQLKYNLLIVTSTGRMLLYNHIRSTFEEIYSCHEKEQFYHVQKEQCYHAQKNNRMSYICTNKLYLHYPSQQQNDCQQNPHIELRLKLAAIFNKQVIPQCIKEHSSSQVKQNKVTNNENKYLLPIAHLKQLKQIILLNSNINQNIITN